MHLRRARPGAPLSPSDHSDDAPTCRQHQVWLPTRGLASLCATRSLLTRTATALSSYHAGMLQAITSPRALQSLDTVQPHICNKKYIYSILETYNDASHGQPLQASRVLGRRMPTIQRGRCRRAPAILLSTHLLLRMPQKTVRVSNRVGGKNEPEAGCACVQSRLTGLLTHVWCGGRNVRCWCTIPH